MREKEQQFKETLYNLSIEELREKERVLSNEIIKLKHNRSNVNASNGHLLEELEFQLLAVKNRITVLKIR